MPTRLRLDLYSDLTIFLIFMATLCDYCPVSHRTSYTTRLKHQAKWRRQENLDPSIFLGSAQYPYNVVQNAQSVQNHQVPITDAPINETNTNNDDTTNPDAMDDVVYDENDISRSPNAIQDVDFQKGYTPRHTLQLRNHQTSSNALVYHCNPPDWRILMVPYLIPTAYIVYRYENPKNWPLSRLLIK